jgi:hypothetical protein
LRCTRSTLCTAYRRCQLSSFQWGHSILCIIFSCALLVHPMNLLLLLLY